MTQCPICKTDMRLQCFYRQPPTIAPGKWVWVCYKCGNLLFPVHTQRIFNQVSKEALHEKFKMNNEEKKQLFRDGIKAFRENNINGQWNEEIEDFKLR